MDGLCLKGVYLLIGICSIFVNWHIIKAINGKPERKRMLKKYPLSIAPMMDWTDRHYRYFMRQITKHTLLYTEMVTSGAVLHGDRQRLLGFSELEKTLVLQLGGDNPVELAECARIAEDFGYDEINL